MSVNTTVWGLEGSTLTPGMEWVAMNDLDRRRRSAGTLAKAVQKLCIPSIRVSKSGRPPKGCAGLQLRSSPRTASAAMTWRGGLVFHMTPVRMVSL